LREVVVVVSRWFEQPEARRALNARDVGAVYRLLQRAGVSQREIARRTGQGQSEVSEIVQGRRVRDVELLERIADGLGVPRSYLRLSGDAENAYSGGVAVTALSGEVVEEMRRRVLLANAGVSLAGRQVDKLGELLTLPDPAPVALPTRIEGIHVAQVRNTTRRLGAAGITDYGDPEVLSVAAARAEKLLKVSGTEAVKRALLIAVAELHIEAGWAGFDAWHYDRALHHFNRALELAITAADAYLQATALSYAGVVIREFGRPNDGLKLLQVGLVKAWEIHDDEPRAVIVGEVGRAAREACAHADLASAYADLGDFHTAERAMATGRGLWGATRADPFGDLDRPAALLALHQGRVDTAEALAAASVRRWEGVSQVGHAQSGIVLATIHVQSGEPDGLRLAHGAITAVTKLSSVRARRRLQPLATALATRPGRDPHDLAQLARQVASAQA
jgi:transcriptional regulator with XRE-family HTH domain